MWLWFPKNIDIYESLEKKFMAYISVRDQTILICLEDWKQQLLSTGIQYRWLCKPCTCISDV